MVGSTTPCNRRKVGTRHILFYYIMHLEFDKDRNGRLATPEELGGDTITIRQSGDNEEVEITHTDCNTAHRTLGVMINPAGTHTAKLNDY
jgi:hypothetical protein